MPFSESLHDWQNFYVVSGGAAAALIGLMFVAVSLGSHLVTSESMDGIRTYVNPTLIHFVIVLLIACTMLVPSHSRDSLVLLLGTFSLAGIWQVIQVMRRMSRRQVGAITEDAHWLWHGLLPFLSYILGGAVAVGIAVSGAPEWLNGIALMVVVLITCAIHNTWILVLWIARQR